MSVLDPPAWTPSVADVALRLIARTRQDNGVLAKTFNTQTQPSDTDVSGIIAQQTSLLGPRLGPVPDALCDSARALVALKCAIVVEQSYFTEQIGAGASPVRELTAEYLSALCDWDMAAKGQEPGGYKIASLPVGTLYPPTY